MRRDEALTHAALWMSLEGTLLRERSQTRKAAHGTIPFTEAPQKAAHGIIPFTEAPQSGQICRKLGRRQRMWWRQAEEDGPSWANTAVPSAAEVTTLHSGELWGLIN